MIMSLGGLIPIATYTIPMLCAILQYTVLKFCGIRIAWAWYGAVSILGLLLGPDKEAVAVFVFLGYYPIVKPGLDRLKFPWLWKGLLFNAAILTMYRILLNLFGMDQLVEEFAELGKVMTLIMLILGNVIFFLLDIILNKYERKGRR